MANLTSDDPRPGHSLSLLRRVRPRTNGTTRRWAGRARGGFAAFLSLVFLILFHAGSTHAAAPSLLETFDTDPVAADRFTTESAGTESSFTHVANQGALTAVLDVDAATASYLSAPFPALTERDAVSFSFHFRINAFDYRVPPTSFIGLLTPQHVENFGDGLTVNLATSEGTNLVAHASLDNAGFKDEGEKIPLIAGTDYLAVASYLPAPRTFTVEIYAGPDFIERVGRSVGSLPVGRGFRVTHLGLQNGGARTQDSAVGSLTLSLDDLSIPGQQPVTLSVEDISHTEGTDGASTATLTISLSVTVDQPVSVDYSTLDESAQGGADYRRSSGTLVIPAGATGARLAIPVIPDNLAESDETLRLRLSNPINAKLARAEAVVRILDDDESVITIGTAEMVEGQVGRALLSLPVTLGNPNSRPIQVRYATEDGSARAGSDYASTNGLVTFPPGTIQQSVLVAALGDRIAEGNEFLSVRLSSPVNARLGEAVGRATILDDDPVPLVDLGEASGTEGNAGPVNVVVPVRLSNPSGVPVTVSFATADGAARAGVDYLAHSGSLTFEPGQTEKTVLVTILGDTLSEGPESFLLKLSNISNAKLGRESVSVIILDDDSAPTLRIADASTTEGPPGRTGTLVFRVTLEPPATGRVTVNYATFPSSASAGNDYTSTSGTLEFAAGVTERTIEVPVLGDDEAEPDETLAVRLGNVLGAEIGDGEAIGTLFTDDSVTISISDVEVTEGDGTTVQAVFAVSLKGNPTQPVTVGYFTANLSAQAGQDYRASNGQLTFNVGQNLQTISVPIVGDRLDEPIEQFELRLNAPAGATLSRAAGIATIKDNDPPSISIADTQVLEGSSGPTNARVVVRLSSPTFEEVRVEWLTLERTASRGSDFVDAGGTLVFPPGTQERTLDVIVLGDTLNEADEDFVVRLARPVGATLAVAEGVVTIRDDDPAPLIRIENREVTECSGGTGSIVFRVFLSAPSGQEVRVSYATLDDSAKAGEDFEPVRGTLVFPPGSTVQEIEVPLICDGTDEPTEGFGIGLGGPVNGFIDGDGRGRGVLIDDDPPEVSVADLAQDEGDQGFTDFGFELRLSSASAEIVTVEFTTSDGTATAGTDYATVSGLVTFPPGTLRRTVSVPVIGDTLPEGRETFLVSLSHPLGAQLGRSAATGTLLDDDQPRIQLADTTVVEGHSGLLSARLRISLSRPSPQPVEVRFATVPGTAQSPADYRATNGVVRIPAGELSADFEIIIGGDVLIEENETFRVKLSEPMHAELATQEATVTIVDDDGVPVLTVADRSLVEPSPGAQAMVFSLRLSAPSSATVSVTVSTADGTARSGEDYAPLRPVPVVFNPGITNRTVSVTVLPDPLFENDENFLLVLSNTVNAVLARPQAVGTIQNDDLPSLLRVDGGSVAEGPTGRRTNLLFRVSLNPPSSTPVSVAFTTHGLTASPGVDFERQEGRLDFPAGTIERLVSVSVLGDDSPEDTETFALRLASPVGAAIAVAEATGTIRDDDGIEIRVSDAEVVEGDSGTSALVFTVSLERAASQLVSVDFATTDGTASAGLDYRAAASTLYFPPGLLSQTVTLEVFGDLVDEPDETLVFRLSKPVGAVLGRALAIGTIRDNDPPVISVDDVTVAASQTGSVEANFTVTLSSTTPSIVTVDYRTQNGSATAGTDYAETTLSSLRFDPNQVAQRLTVQVKGNTLDEATEFFLVRLENPVGATLGRALGRGTILNPREVNKPPTVVLTSPANQATFLTPADVTLAAEASDPENSLVGVEFFAGPLSLGLDTSAPYGLVWSNAPPGTHLLTARALDTGGLSVTSAPVRITVSVPNRPPSLASLPARTTLEDVPTALLPLLIDDAETPAGLLDLAVAASNPQLIASGGLALGGVGRDRTLRVTPLPDQFGTTSLAVTVRDAEGLSTIQRFDLTVLPVNDPPTLAPLPNLNLSEDAPARTILLTGIGTGVPNELQTLTLTATSSNPDLIPPPFILHSGTASTGSLTFQPKPDSQGTAIITVTVKDDGGTANGGRDNFSRSFTVFVAQVNDPPSIAWLSPADGAEFKVGTPILLAAEATDPDDGVAAVEFLLESTIIARSTQPPYRADWSEVPPGTYRLVARARDSSGATAETAAREIRVVEPIRDLPGGDILIVRDHGAVEIDHLRRYIEQSSYWIPDALDRHLRPPVVVVVDPDNLDLPRLLGYRLIIWDDLGAEEPGLGEREIDLLWQAWRFGIPTYLIGENLALPRTRLPARAREQWYQLSGLAPGDAPLAPGRITPGEPRQRSSELFSGSIPETLGLVLGDFDYPRSTHPGRLIGDGEVRATLSGTPILTRYPAFDSPFDDSARRLVQGFLVTAGPEKSLEERRLLFLNAVVWLLGAECDNFASTADGNVFPPDPADPDPCAPLTFRAFVSNNGRCQVRGVWLTTVIPPGFRVVETRVSSFPEGVNDAVTIPGDGRIEFAAGRMAPDSQLIVEVLASPPGPGTFVFEAFSRALYRPVQTLRQSFASTRAGCGPPKLEIRRGVAVGAEIRMPGSGTEPAVLEMSENLLRWVPASQVTGGNWYPLAEILRNRPNPTAPLFLRLRR